MALALVPHTDSLDSAHVLQFCGLVPRIGSEAAAIIGARIAEARLSAGATQMDLAYHARVNPSSLASYESGRALPNLSTLVRLAQTLSIDPGELIRDLSWASFPQDRESPVPLKDVLPKRRVS